MFKRYPSSFSVSLFLIPSEADLGFDHPPQSSGTFAATTTAATTARTTAAMESTRRPFRTPCSVQFNAAEALIVSEVQEDAKRRVTEIFKSWITLREVLRRHEDKLQRRWLKKAEAKRVRVLLDAWRDMPKNHGADFETFRRGLEVRRGGRDDTGHREKYLWPYINQEDLSSPWALPLLLKSRGRSLPSVFACADSQRLKFGIEAGAVVPVVLENHTMRLDDIAHYGQVSERECPTSARFDGCNGVPWSGQFPPGIGLLVLEVQERLLAFLLGCCRQILHDIPENSWATNAFPVESEPHLDLRSKGKSAGHESLAEIAAAEAPYRVPGRMDLNELVCLLDSSAAAAEDRLWALREDPLYFFDQLLETKEDGHKLWTKMVAELVSDVVFRLETFTGLYQQAKELQVLQTRDANNMPLGGELPNPPGEYTKALDTFRRLLYQSSQLYLTMFKIVGRQSPLRRRIVSRCATKLEARVFWLLEALWGHGDDLSSPAGVPTTVDELERLLNREPKAKELISPLTSGLINDLSIISQCMRQTEDHYARAGVYTPYEEYESDSEPSWAFVLDRLSLYEVTVVEELVEPFKRGFSYPIEKRRTKDNVDALRRAEQNLDRMWEYIDQQLGDLSGTATGRCLVDKRPLNRTPPWVEPVPNEKTKAAVPDSVSVFSDPFSSLLVGESIPSKTAFDSIPLRNKTKTKGTPNPPQVLARDPPAPAMPDARLAPSISVDHRALKVFRVLFYNPDRTSTPGGVAWREFLHAMNQAGFSSQKIYGSVWQFQPAGSDLMRGIQFHEPHPTGKIPFWTARRHGRRLDRAYGWGGDTFVLE